MNDARLLLVGRGGVDLGALLTVGAEQVELDARGQGGLAVFFGDLDVAAAVAARAVLAAPAEEGRDHVLPLPIKQLEGFSRPLAFGVAQEFREE